MKNTIFICYSSLDKDKAYELRNFLVENNKTIWSTQDDLIVGQNREIESKKVIKESYSILICISKSSQNVEGEFQTEIKFAIKAAEEKPDGTIFIIPVLFDECELPYSLSHLAPSKFFEPDAPQKLLFALDFQEKINAVSTIVKDYPKEENMTEMNVLLSKMQEKVKQAKEKELRFVVIGLTGAGKSSTINSLFGENVAEVNPFEATTHSVFQYTNESTGIKYKIFDTPGLGESEDESQNQEYVEKIKEEVKEVDCVLYITHLDEPRVRGDEKRCIKLFSNALGSSIWRHSLIVFTLKHPLSSEQYNLLLKNRAELIRSEIYKHTNLSLAGEIPATAINISSQFTPDKKEWISELFLNIFERISETSRLSFVIANANRIDNGEIPLTSKQKESITDKLSLSYDTVMNIKAVAAAGVLGSAAILGGAIAGTFGSLVLGALASIGVVKYFRNEENKK